MYQTIQKKEEQHSAAICPECKTDEKEKINAMTDRSGEINLMTDEKEKPKMVDAGEHVKCETCEAKEDKKKIQRQTIKGGDKVTPLEELFRPEIEAQVYPGFDALLPAGDFETEAFQATVMEYMSQFNNKYFLKHDEVAGRDRCMSIKWCFVYNTSKNVGRFDKKGPDYTYPHNFGFPVSDELSHPLSERSLKSRRGTDSKGVSVGLELHLQERPISDCVPT